MVFVNALSSKPHFSCTIEELEKSNSVLEKALPFCTYDKIFDMKQKRLNGHKLSKVEPSFKAKRTSEKKKTETERKIDILLHTISYPQI